VARERHVTRAAQRLNLGGPMRMSLSGKAAR
jgi:DNA-binding transcriptional LysR family regulator